MCSQLVDSRCSQTLYDNIPRGAFLTRAGWLNIHAALILAAKEQLFTKQTVCVTLLRTITKLRLSSLKCTDICSVSLEASVSSSQHKLASLDIATAAQEHMQIVSGYGGCLCCVTAIRSGA